MNLRIALKPSTLSAPLSYNDDILPYARAEGSNLSSGFGVYIHWPYCEAKCPYCDFNSYARRSITEEQFVSGTLRELEFYERATRAKTVTSVFFGGGTPSLMSPASVGTILEKVSVLWAMAPACEITLEANPSSVEAGRFAAYRASGVNRVSLGVQSLRDDALRFLGRLHSAAEARTALEIANKHFNRVSFDLIYARPSHSVSAWRSELTEALRFQPSHLSLYQLTIEPETAFFDLERRGKLSIPSSDMAADLYEVTQELCDAAGLPAYEVSNHAQAGQESRHNLTYWRYGDYIGIGPGAHGRITLDSVKQATTGLRSPQAWLQRALEPNRTFSEATALSSLEQSQEMLLMGMRLREGLCLSDLERHTRHTVPLRAIVPLVEEGLLSTDETRVLRTTGQGRLVLNAVVAELSRHLAPIEMNVFL